MSKSNTDFSAFDFNDSSDNSDIASRTPLFNRSTLSNNNSNCSLKINVNNNMNNSNHEHHNINSNSQHSDQSNNSRKSRASSSSSTTSSASSSSNSSSSNDNDHNLSNNKKRNESKLVTNVNEHLLQQKPNNNRQRTINNNDNNHQQRQVEADAEEDDEDDDDDDDDEDYDDDEDDLSNNNNNNSRNHHHNSRAKTNNSNSHSHGNSNNIRADGLLIGTALRRDNNGCSNLDAKMSAASSGADGVATATGGNSNNNNNSNLITNSMQAAAAAVAAVAAAAASNAVSNNMNESSGHTGNPVGGLGMTAGNLNCGEFARCSSASLSNSCSTNLGGITGGVGAAYNSSERKKYRHQNYSKNIYIGTKNAEKWELTRSRLRFKNDVEFVAYLLNLADNDPERLANLPPPSACTTPTKGFSGNFKLEPNLSVKDFAIKTEAGTVGRKKGKKRVQFSDSMVNGISKMKDFSNFALKAKKHEQKMKNSNSRHTDGNTNNNGDMLPEVLDCRIAEKIKNELAEKTRSTDVLPDALCLKKGNNNYTQDEEDDDADTETEKVVAGTSATNPVDGSQLSPGNFRMRMKNNKKANTSSQYGPLQSNKAGGSLLSLDEEGDDDEDTGSDDDELDEDALEREMRNEQNFVEEDDEHDLAFRSEQSCRDCSITHDYKVCPLHNARGIITDAVDLSEWIERKNLEALAKLKANAQRHSKRSCDDDEDMDETSQMSELETKPLITFAEASVPAEFELHNVEPNVTGVFARTDVRAFTKLGPLIGQVIQRNDLNETSNMKWIFEICEPGAEKSQLLCCDSPNTSNWLRYIRPSPTYEERTVNLVSIDRQAFFVTNRDLKNGMELLYWSDDCNTMWRKKQNDKTICGGCNIKFDHYLYYRTHCSIFHDPTMSLTIRKYHCKVCGDVVLGKDNIMKHAIDIHDGKGAYQCQFCNKYFLRSNYLELHRTYGCSLNPNRTRPLCDFCGRKFCQPQKLKAHIKRVHSGSRAALQRHSKEVHSRNSTVVSCPRCQKLFQNRSNLKIHMLTHSGVRPFKCAESECNAAFTTKQCLQFHYKKVHNYTQEQMPKIERSVAYTFDAYSGGMKVDFLEQAPRRRRKSLEDQNSILSSSMQSDTEFSDDNIFEAIKKSGKSIKDLCRNEPNLSLLSSKISSIFGDKVVGSRKRKKKKDLNNSLMPNPEGDDDDHLEHVRRKQNAQLSLVESFLTTTAQRLQQQQVQQVVAAAAAMAATSVSDDPSKMHNILPGLNAQHMGLGHSTAINNEDDDEDDEDEDDISRHNPASELHHDTSAFRHHSGLNTHGHNLVVSKGSKKWISGDDRHLSNERCSLGTNDIVNNGTTSTNNPALVGQGSSCNLPVNSQNTDIGLPTFAVPSTSVDNTNKLIGQNRDFLARLMNSASGNHNHSHHNTCHREEDENTSFLDVVESNNNSTNTQVSQYHHNNNSAVNTTSSTNSNNPASVTDTSTTNQPTHNNSEMQMPSLSHTQQSFMSSFYNNANARMTGPGSSASTSASMLVEAALNSVGNMIDSDNNDMKVPTDNNINNDSPMSSHVDSDSNRYANASNNSAMNSMDNLEKELSMMKNLSNFPMPPLPIFSNSANEMNSCLSPNTSASNNPQNNQLNNEVEVDAGSTPRQQNVSANTGDSDRFSTTHHRTPPSPQPISPGRDYSMFGTNATGTSNTSGGPGTSGSSGSGNSTGTANVANNISASSPLQNMQPQRRTGSSVSSNYPEHELISPASSPSIPRYNFNDELLRHKRAEVENERRQNINHNQLSSDEENSLMPQNSVTGQDMRLKFSQPQMDLMYSKYESMTNAANLKYNNQVLESSAEYRSSNSNAVATPGTTSDMSDLQGLDMSSRSGVSSSSNYHHNFQLPSSAASNLPSIGRYHHHIYDILSEREQNQQSQSQSAQHHSSVAAAAAAAAQHQEHSNQLQAMQHQTTMHNMLSDQLSEQEHDQATSVDLSRTANYVVPSPPQLPYNHPHHDMLRMASLDLTPNTNMSVGNNRSFLPSQMQHQSRDSLEHHRLLSTVEQHRILAASNAADQHRLLVDPTAHLLMEQNNRLLGTDQSRLLGDSTQNRHMARGFGAYHQVASGNYHHGVRPVLPSPNHHASNPTNYHPFPAYY